jgi:hypothetical protein
MNELKKHIFWVILGAVSLLAAGAWLYFTPSVSEAEAELDKKAMPLRNQKRAEIKTDAHKNAAEAFKKKQDAEKAALIDTIKTWPQLADIKELQKRYPAAPADNAPIDFNKWMGEQRTRLRTKLTEAGIVPPDFDKLMPVSKGLDPSSVDPTKHRDYQLRLLALIDDVVEALGPRTGSMPILQFETDPQKPEPAATAQVGALSMLDFRFHTTEETKKAQGTGYDEAQVKGGRPKKAGGPDPKDVVFKGNEMPVAVSSMDIEFTSHVSAIPPLLRRVEANEHYHGVVSKVDFERIPPTGLQIYPGAITDTRTQQDYAKAEFKPTINTHYGEAAVKVAVTVDLYEFDQKKFEAMDAKPATTGPGPKGRTPPKPPAPAPQ